MYLYDVFMAMTWLTGMQFEVLKVYEMGKKLVNWMKAFYIDANACVLFKVICLYVFTEMP